MNTPNMTIEQGLKLAQKMRDQQQHQKAHQIHEQMISSQPGNPEIYALIGNINLQQGNVLGAEALFNKATLLMPNNPNYLSQLGHALRAQGKINKAIDTYHQALKVDPVHFSACSGLAYSLMPGEPYGQVISRFHTHLKPASYVEIGIQSGKTLAHAKPPTLAIGIDPDPVINVDFRAETKIYPLRSDDFFETHDLAIEMGKDTVDLAFLDGLHLFEQTLKDFMNIERYSTTNTIIVIHDCLPLNKVTAARERMSKFWSGDPWKIIPCLKQYRPDLKIFVIATPPTGLGVITGLDPQSTTLKDNWPSILDEYINLEYTVSENQRSKYFNLVTNDWKVITQQLEKH